jgi:hypothetical protein
MLDAHEQSRSPAADHAEDLAADVDNTGGDGDPGPLWQLVDCDGPAILAEYSAVEDALDDLDEATRLLGLEIQERAWSAEAAAVGAPSEDDDDNDSEGPRDLVAEARSWVDQAVATLRQVRL